MRADVLLRFLRGPDLVGERAMTLHAAASDGVGGSLLGWVEAPRDATHVQFGWPGAMGGAGFEEVSFHRVGERAPKCHPLAAVPRWSSYRPPFPIGCVFLPPVLSGLAPLLRGQEVRLFQPRSKEQLRQRIRGAACVLDPLWVVELRLSWQDVERLAAESWLVVDLESVWRLLRQARVVPTELVTQSVTNGLMAARVEYADVATRGFALQDVFPYATVDASGGFSMRVLRADRAWKRYADELGFATMLASETPSSRCSGDVLSAARPIGRGGLIATDLPWLVAGCHGPMLAPRLAQHSLRMHLAGPITDCVQHWNRWEDSEIVLRDLADLPRRFPPLQTLRLASTQAGIVRVGIGLSALTQAESPRTLALATGRIDAEGLHDGLPPEPMAIFMKMLARDARERTPWAAQYLGRLHVWWQFESAAGLRYAVNYAAADEPRGARVVRVRRRTGWAARESDPGVPVVEIEGPDEGLLGDGSLDYQARLDARLRALIESTARAGAP